MLQILMKDIMEDFFNTGRRLNNGLIRLGQVFWNLVTEIFKNTIKVIKI